jgi:hypothetical protein
MQKNFEKEPLKTAKKKKKKGKEKQSRFNSF